MSDDKSAAEIAAEERWPIYSHGVTDTRAVPDLLRYRSCFVQGAEWAAARPVVQPDRNADPDYLDRIAGTLEEYSFEDNASEAAALMHEAADEIRYLRSLPSVVQRPTRDELAEVLPKVYDHGTQPNAYREADEILRLLSVFPGPTTGGESE